MRSVGIVCEYNPFHLGHARQLEAVRRMAPEAAVVCLMSGFYVQQGQPAVFDRTVRTKAAPLAGADLVLELPVTVSLRSAEGFAAGAVELLSRLGVEGLCFRGGNRRPGAASGHGPGSAGQQAVRGFAAVSGPGLSFPAARSRAAADLGADATVLERPNDILAVEYCKAILAQGSKLTPLPIARPGDYHAREADRDNPSATALRLRILTGQPWLSYVPEAVRPAYAGRRPTAGLGGGGRFWRGCGPWSRRTLPCFPALRRDCGESCAGSAAGKIPWRRF